MADAVTTQIIEDSLRNFVAKYTNISDGTGEAAVQKTTISTMVPVPAGLKLMRIKAATFGMGVDILWDATADVLCFHVPTDMNVDQDFTVSGGIQNNAGAGKTGNVMFTTVGHTLGDRYSIWLHFVKKY